MDVEFKQIPELEMGDVIRFVNNEGREVEAKVVSFTKDGTPILTKLRVLPTPKPNEDPE